jgi:predicted dithiol-disulfide oxidoreductase (DUF899 family)
LGRRARNVSFPDTLLDLTPLGRQDEDVELRHHDKYPEDGHDRQSD